MRNIEINCATVSLLTLLKIVDSVLQMQSPIDQNDLRREKQLANPDSATIQRKYLFRQPYRQLRKRLSIGIRNKVFSSIIVCNIYITIASINQAHLHFFLFKLMF